ncbi:MFS transporter [Nocardioides sp.]|uniref:MFS transporter n=1 Tax=Nocardioides sp. TaxID=35761 RepID=UPI0035116B18
MGTTGREEGPEDDARRDEGVGEGALALSSRRGRWLLTVAVLGSAVAQIEATVVNIALPAIGSDLDADVAALQWVLNGYLLSLAGLVLLGGSLGDRLGRRRVFVLGVALFTLTSALCAAAPNVETLVAARVLQGVGAALLTPGSLALLESLLRPEDRARAIGAWSALGGVAAALGPLLGGWLVEYSWRWVFLVPVPLGLLVVVVGTTRIPESRDPGASGRLDAVGAVLATAGLGLLTFALISASDGDRAAVGVAVVVGMLALVGFWRYESRHRDPMLDPTLFASRTFTVANLLTFAVYAGLGGVFFLFVVFLQTTMGYTPLQAGSASLPITVLMLVLSARAGAVTTRLGPRLPLTVGAVLIAAGMLLLSAIDPGERYLTSVLPAVVVLGLGLASTVAPVTATVLGAVEDRHAGMASGINNAVARTAQLAAVAALPLVVGLTGDAYDDPVALATGFERAMWITAALALVGAVLAAVGLPPGPSSPPPGPVATDRSADDATHLSCGVAGPPVRPTRRRH